jgi:PelA/Pel-15E family pectate lyase
MTCPRHCPGPSWPFENSLTRAIGAEYVPTHGGPGRAESPNASKRRGFRRLRLRQQLRNFPLSTDLMRALRLFWGSLLVNPGTRKVLGVPSRTQVVRAVGCAWVLSACASPNSPSAPGPRSPAYVAVSLAGFADGIRHFQKRRGSDYARYSPQQIVEIAENVLLYQRNNGGWPENQDLTRILSEPERTRILGDRFRTDTSFDNRNIFSQIEYLAAVHGHTDSARYREAYLRGLEFVGSTQYESCGGWPHTLPGRERYHSLITIADEVTPGVLTMLRKVAHRHPPFEHVDEATVVRASRAVERGDRCLLRLQVVQRDALTGWAGQYDPTTLFPAPGRSFELPAIVSQETVGVVRYLMGIRNPSSQVVASIEAAVAWLDRSKLSGLRLETFPAEPVKYKYHTSDTDHRLVEDATGPPLWARFYDLVDNSVILANRDGKRVAKYDQVLRERRTGYAWYGTWPASLLSRDYPAWRLRLARP